MRTVKNMFAVLASSGLYGVLVVGLKSLMAMTWSTFFLHPAGLSTIGFAVIVGLALDTDGDVTNEES